MGHGRALVRFAVWIAEARLELVLARNRQRAVRVGMTPKTAQRNGKRERRHPHPALSLRERVIGGVLASRSGANFSSSAGFDGFAKENAATASTITFRKSRFRVSAARPSPRRLSCPRIVPSAPPRRADCKYVRCRESIAVVIRAASGECSWICKNPAPHTEFLRIQLRPLRPANH